MTSETWEKIWISSAPSSSPMTSTSSMLVPTETSVTETEREGSPWSVGAAGGVQAAVANARSEREIREDLAEKAGRVDMRRPLGVMRSAAGEKGARGDAAPGAVMGPPRRHRRRGR